ncbi:MAG: alpha-amylase family glycosyl hydrolase [Nannocystaceae bacterium]
MRIALALLLAAACGKDELHSASSLEPPDTDGFDPSDGFASVGSYSSSVGSATSADSGDESGTTGPTECEPQNKRCAHEFALADMGYASVEVFGDFASDGWDVGVPLSKDGDSWRASVPVPFEQQVLYKFRTDGTTWMPDPANPEMMPDGQGGQNSVLQPITCEDYTCEPDVVGTFDWRDSVIYFVFVDRFENGDPSNDGGIGVPMAADFQGGDWAGVTARIDDGYFEDLGVNTLWLTVPLDNTDDSGMGSDGHEYSAYHGYWPARVDQTEGHFGTLAELQQLVDTAHEHGLKVLFDYAMNHVHISSPVYADHPEWFWPNDNGQGGDCVCGSGCSWDGDQARRCWFTPYLPDYDFTDAGARMFSIDNALQWVADTGVDGFRLDAVKHIEDQWLLDLRARVLAEVEPESGEHFYMVGETFTGDQGLIAHYVGADMLDGQFDFPLRMQLARNVLMRAGTMQELASFMDGNDEYYGAAIMSTFIGNHDIPRAIHLAQDTPVWNDQWADGKDRAWSNQPGLPTGNSAFERLANAFAILMTTKGAPLVYYGDEYGMAGAGDPDNRRAMQWQGYSAGQMLLHDRLQRLIAIRAAHPATRRGTRDTIAADADTFAYHVSYGGDELWVLVNRSDVAHSIGGVPAEMLVDEITDESLMGPSIDVPPRSTRVLARP